MACALFPQSPTLGQQYPVGAVTYEWDGQKWKSVAGPLVHNNLSGRDVVGAHDSIYSRNYSNVSDMLSEAEQLTAGYRYVTGGTVWEYKGISAGDITDFKPITPLIAADFHAFDGTDATAEMLQLASISEGRDVVFPVVGDIVLTQGITFPNARSVSFGNISVNYSAANTATPLAIGQTVVTEKHTLSAPADRHTKSIIMDDVSGLSVGSMLSVYNTTDGSYNASRPAYRQGEFVFVDRISGNEVFFTNALIDDYPATTTKIYLVETSKTAITGKLSVTNTGAYATCYGLRIESVIDSDFSGLEVNLFNGTHALSLNRCANCSGSAMAASQQSSTVSGLNYGLTQASCQNNSFEGRFNAERHGSTTGNDGSFGGAVNRFLTIKGSVTTTGLGSVQAADFHGDTEHCSYEGYLEGAIIGGHDNTIKRGSVVVSPKVNLPPIAYTELKSTKQTASGITVICNGQPTSSRGIIDAGGGTTIIGSFTTIGGVFDFSACHLIAPDLTGTLIAVRNRGATGIDYSIDLRGITTEAPTAATAISCSPVSGDNVNTVWFDNDFGFDYAVAGSTSKVLGLVQEGKESITLNTGANTVSVTVTFPSAFPSGRIPIVTVSSSKGVVGTALLFAAATNSLTSSFVAHLATSDGSNFATSESIDVYWKAESRPI